MSFWLKRILYSLRVLPILFSVIIALISIRLLLVFTGIIHTHEILPIGSAMAAAKDEKAAPPQDKTDKKPDAKQDSSKPEAAQKTETEQKPKAAEKEKDASPKPKDEPAKPKDRNEPPQDIKKEGSSATPDPKDDTTEASDEEEDDFSQQKIDLLQKLKDRNDLLLKNEQKLTERSEILKTVEHKIEEKYKELDQKRLELEKVKSSLSELDKKIIEEDEKKLQSLVKIYQTMKPKDAARIFDQLDMRVLLDVISRMKEGNTAPILANMTPERAKNVTMYLAQKRRTPKLEE